jgi:hypothetical protein
MKTVAVFIAGLILGLVLSFPIKVDDPTIKVVKEYEPIVRYKYEQQVVFNNPELLKNCYTSPIQIEPTFGKGYVEINAEDSCKQSIQRFDLEISQSSNWRFYIGVGAVGVIGGIIIARML